MTKQQIERARRNHGTGWAWLCRFGVCNYAAPSKEDLLKHNLPSPEAIPVRVTIIPLKRQAKGK